MPKYTEEELYSLRENGKVPEGVDLKAFNDMIADVTVQLQKRFESEAVNHNGHNHHAHGPTEGGKFTFRRRSSRHEARPHFKKNFRKHESPVQTDADGWVTLKNTRKSFGAGGNAEESRDEFREAVKSQVVKAKPNTKKIGTRAAADTKEAVAEKQTKTFNAFSALGSDDSGDENEEEEEQEQEDDEEDEEEK